MEISLKTGHAEQYVQVRDDLVRDILMPKKLLQSYQKTISISKILPTLDEIAAKATPMHSVVANAINAAIQQPN